jgi:hypothetical protein
VQRVAQTYLVPTGRTTVELVPEKAPPGAPPRPLPPAGGVLDHGVGVTR